MLAPIDKYRAEDYRADLRTADAPQMLDTAQPIVPVVVVGQGFPKMNSRQRLRYMTLSFDATARTVQVATPDSTKRIWFLGYTGSNYAAVANSINIWDASSGVSPTVTPGTGALDESGYLGNASFGAVGPITQMLPFPTLVKQGIRISDGTVASTNATIIVWFIEELV